MRAEYPVGPVFKVEFHLSGDRFHAAWSPCVPPSAALPGLLPAYTSARNEFLAMVATDLGGAVAVVDGSGVTGIAPRTVH